MRTDAVRMSAREPMAHVHDTQAMFRLLLEATANPGRILECPDLAPPPPGFNLPASAAIITLCDLDTCLWLSPSYDALGLRSFFGFHCGVQLSHLPESADYAIVNTDVNISTLDRLKDGTDEYPDRSATVIVIVDELTNEGGITLRGPGIPASRSLHAPSLRSEFWQWAHRRRAKFPRGVDIIFCSPNKLAALPRSTHLEC